MTNHPHRGEPKYQTRIRFSCPGCGREAKRLAPGNAPDDLYDLPHICHCGLQMLLSFNPDQSFEILSWSRDTHRPYDPDVDDPDEDEWHLDDLSGDGKKDE